MMAATGTPNLILVPNQSVGGNLQQNLTPQVVDISAVTGGTLYAGVETSTVGQLYTLIRDPSTGAAMGVQQVGAITEANGSAVFNLAHSLATNGDGFYVIGSSGESYVPFQTVGGDLGNDDPLNIKAMSISTDLLGTGKERVFVIDSDGSSLRLFEITKDGTGAVTGYDNIGQITDPASGIPILGMTSLAINPTSNDIVSIGYRADEAAPSLTSGYIGDSFDVRGLTVTPNDLTQNNQTYFIHRQDPFLTGDFIPAFDLYQVTRDPLTNAVLSTVRKGTVTDPLAAGANVLRFDSLESDPIQGNLYGIGIPFAVGSTPEIPVQGDLGDVYRVLDIAATQFSSSTLDNYHASLDSIFAIVGNNTTADLYRIRQNGAQTADSNSGIADQEGVRGPNGPMEKIGQLVDISGRPIYFAQGLTGSNISGSIPANESSGNDTNRYLWFVGSASPTAGSPMTLYKVDAVQYATSQGNNVVAMEEYALTGSTTSLTSVVKGITQVAWDEDLWNSITDTLGSDGIADTHTFYIVVDEADGDKLYSVTDSSNHYDQAGNALPDWFLDARIVNGNIKLVSKLSQEVSSIAYANIGGVTGTVFGLTGNVGDANRKMISLVGSGGGGSVDPYLRGLTFLNTHLPYGFEAGYGTMSQVYSVRGDLTLPQNDELWTMHISTNLYQVDATTGTGAQINTLLFNSANPLAAPVDPTSPLTTSQLRDWQIRPEKSDVQFKAMTIDTDGVKWVVFDFQGKQYLATIESKYTRSTDFGSVAQLNVKGVLSTDGGATSTNIQGLDFTRTGELLALDKPSTTSNRLISINQNIPSQSLSLVTDTTTSTGTANLMAVLAKHDTDGYTSNPLGRFLTIVPDDITPVDSLNTPVRIIPNAQRPYGSIAQQLNITDFAITSKVDFSTGQGKTYAIDYSTGQARLVQLDRDISGQFIGSHEVYSTITDLAGSDLENWHGLIADPTGFLYGIATDYTSPRPTGAVDVDEYEMSNNKGVELTFDAASSLATTPDGHYMWVVTSSGQLSQIERDVAVDSFYGQGSYRIINHTIMLSAKLKNLLKGFDGKTTLSNYQGLEVNAAGTELYLTAVDSSDANRRLFITLDAATGNEIRRQFVFDVDALTPVLSSETLLASLHLGTGVTLGTTMTVTTHSGANFIFTPSTSLRTIDDLAKAINGATGGLVSLAVVGDGKAGTVVLTDSSTAPTTMTGNTALSTFHGGAGVNGNSSTLSFNITDSNGNPYLINVDASLGGNTSVLDADDVIQAINKQTKGAVIAQIDATSANSFQLLFSAGANAFQVSDIKGSTAAADLGIATAVAAGSTSLTGSNVGSFVSPFTISGQLAADLLVAGVAAVGNSITSTASLEPVDVLKGEMLGLVADPQTPDVWYAVSRYVNAENAVFQRIVQLTPNGADMKLEQLSTDLTYLKDKETGNAIPTNISGLSFAKDATATGELQAIDHQGGKGALLSVTKGGAVTVLISASAQSSPLAKVVDNSIWDLATDQMNRVYTARSDSIWMNSDSLYKISPTDGLAVWQTELITDAASGQIAMATAEGVGGSTIGKGTGVNSLAFSPTGDMYILSTYYATPEIAKLTYNATQGWVNQTLSPLGSTGGGKFGPGEVGYNFYTSTAIQNPWKATKGFDIQFTKTGSLVMNGMIRYDTGVLQGFVVPSNTNLLMEIDLSDASNSRIRSSSSDDGSSSVFTSQIDAGLVAMATDSQGVFFGVHDDGVNSDAIWRGNPDELFISTSDQSFYKIDSTNAQATVINVLKDTSQVLSRPVSDVFQSLLYLPNGQLYGTLKDVRTNNVNRLISFNTTAGLLDGTFARVGKAAGLITIDNGLAGISDVNIQGLVFVNNKLIGVDRINEQLVTINFDVTAPANSQTNLSSGLSSLGSTDSLTGLISDSGGKIYSVFENTAGPWQLWVNDFNQSLYVYLVNAANAQATNLGKLLDFDTQLPYEPGAFSGLVYDTGSSKLYGVLHNTDADGNKNDNGDYLVTISTKGDAQVLSVGQIQVAYTVSDVRPALINSIELRNGQIIAYDDSNVDGAGKGRQIITIDPSNPSASTVLVAGNQAGIDYLDSSLVGLAVDPLKGRLYSLKPGDGVSAGLAKYDQLFLSDRLYAYNQIFSNLETDNTSAHQSLQIDLPGLLEQVFGVDPVTGITVANPSNVRISEVFDATGKSVDLSSGQFVFTTTAGIIVTVFQDGRVQLQQTNFYNGAINFTFKATNGTLTTASNKVVITIPEVNEAPIGTKDYTYEVNRGQTVTIDAALLMAGVFPGPTPETAGSNDKYTWPAGGLEPDATVIKEISQAMALKVTSGVGGTVALVNNVVTFTPTAGFVGQASFTYTVTDNGTTNSAADPLSVTRTVTVFVGTRPQVIALTDIQPNPTRTPVSTMDVTFAAAIDPATFDFNDLILTLNGATITLDSSVVVTIDAKDNTLYHVTGLENFTIADGTYQLTVDVTNIVDPTFNKKGLPDGNKSETWVMDTIAPVVGAYPAFDPNPRNIVGPASITISFNEAIPDAATAALVPGLATFDNTDLLLTLNGTDQKASASFTVLPVLASKTQVGDLFGYTQWTITGLDKVSSEEGLYGLLILPAGLTDLAGNTGTATAADTQTFVVDKTAPQTKVIGPVVPDPRNGVVTTITVVFNEAIPDATTAGKVAGLATFDLADLVLTLDGKSVVLPGTVTVTADPLSATQVGALIGYTSWIISGLDTVTSAQGNYSLAVDPTKLTDLAGNAGAASIHDVDTWTMDTTAPTTASIGPIVPNPRNTPAPASVTVTFSEAVPDASFADARLHTLVAGDFTVTFNGVDLGASGSLTVAPVLASKVVIGDVYGYTQWTVAGLETVSSMDGNYVLSVDPTKVTDLAGNAGIASATDSTPWVMDTVAPVPTALGPVAPNPRNTRVSSVTVVFSESIQPSTLLTSNFSLTLDGTQVSLSSATIAAVPGSNNTRFTIAGLEPMTGQAGTYVLTVNAGGVKDLADNVGVASATQTTSWIMDLTPAQVLTVGPVTPDPRNKSVSTVSVTFDKPMDANSFSTANISNVLTLVLNGNKMDISGVVITPVDSSKVSVGDLYGYTAFTIGNLNSATSLEGSYTLTVLGTQVQDVAGNYSKNDLGTSWVMDQTSVFVSQFGTNVSSPRNTVVDIVHVVFSETIKASTFTTSLLTLYRTVNGKTTTVPLTSDVKITPLTDGTTYSIVGLGGSLTSPEGLYTLALDSTKITDIAGNSGTGVVSKQWLMDTSAPTAKLTAPNITDHSALPQTLTVTYTDQAGVSVNTLQTGNITIFGPGGLSVQATLVSINPGVNGSPITAVYSMAAPGGEWNALDNGSYTVVVNSNTVGDILGQKMAQSVLGAFEVSIVGIPAIQVTVGGAVVTSPYAANFGLHSVGETSNINFVFKDVGDGVLLITGVTVPSGYKILDGLGSSINPNSSDTLRIGLDTTVPRKTTDAQILVTTNAGNFVINASGEVFSGIALVSGKAVTYTDATGDKVSVMLRGPGSGVLYFNASGNADAARVELQDTTGNSSLTFTLASGKTTTIQSIAVGNADIVNDQTSIGSIAAGSVNVGSFVRIAGSAKTITLGNLTNSLIEVGQSDAYSGQVSISAKHIADTKVHSDIGVSSFRAWDWLDTAASYNSILEAPVVGSMSFLGYAASKVVGNFQADVQIAGPVSGLGLNQFRASGLVSSSVWNVGGTGINSFNAGSFTGVDIDTTGRIGSVTTTANTTVSGMIHAMSIGTMNLRGPVNGLDVDLGSSASPNQLDLQSFTAHSSVKNLNLSTHGKASTINIIGTLGDGVTSSKITIGSTLTSLSAYSAVGTAIDVAGNVSSIRFTKTLPTGEGILDSQINAFAISTFSVTGNVVGSEINLGDQTLFGAKDHVPSVGVAVPNTLPASTNFTITGAMQDSAVKIGGNARTISINKGMTESDLQVIGNIVTLNVGAISNTVTGKVTDHLIKADQIGTFAAKGGISKGTVNAVVINNFNVTGSMTNAVLTLSLAPSTLKALGAFTVSGNVTGTTVTSAGNVGNVTINGTAGITSSQLRAFGNIGQVSVSKMIDTVLFAGVSSLVTGLPSATGDFTNTAATIAGVTVRTAGVSFIRSYIAAGGTLTRVALKGVDPVNPAGIFGVAAGVKIGSYSATGQTTRTNLTAIGDYNAVGNFRLRIV
jgi:hypothetical protein